MESREHPSIFIFNNKDENLLFLEQNFKSRYTLVFPETYEKLLSAAQELKPELIIVFVYKTDTGSFNLLSSLKSSDVTQPIPVIIVSEISQPEDEVRFLSLGAEDFIAKPYHNTALYARVEKSLQVTKYIRAIAKLSHIDTLTGLYNRRGFESRIMSMWSISIRGKKPISILMIDIDNFKSINDTYGHPQGDSVLQVISQVLMSSIRRSSDLAARWGGEEFAVLLPNTGLSGAHHVAESIRAAVSNLRILSDLHQTPIRVTVSIGLASLTPTADCAINDFIAHADKALYTAKQTGKNKICQYE